MFSSDWAERKQWQCWHYNKVSGCCCQKLDLSCALYDNCVKTMMGQEMKTVTRRWKSFSFILLSVICSLQYFSELSWERLQLFKCLLLNQVHITIHSAPGCPHSSQHGFNLGHESSATHTHPRLSLLTRIYIIITILILIQICNAMKNMKKK